MATQAASRGSYHGPGDTFERLEYAKMAEVVLGVLAFLVASPAP
jgi:hypothetical protein